MSFSALQRAENSSIDYRADDAQDLRCAFQCSSASRKFLNTPSHNITSRPNRVSVLFSEPKIPQSGAVLIHEHEWTSFSALQRAENSSIELLIGSHLPEPDVSVLFSEPKIPQYVL